MASTSSVITKRVTGSQVLLPILEKLDEESLKKLVPFIPEIEEHIVRNIESVPEEKLTRVSRAGLVSAAIYDAFLVYEHQTKVRVRTPLIAESLGILKSIVNMTWLHFFDTRVRLDSGRIERINWRSENPKRLVSAVITSLQNAVKEKPSGIDEWFTSVEAEAMAFIHLLDREVVKDYPSGIVAIVAVYGVIKNQGKPIVPLSQKEAGLVCNISPAMISKVWLALFDEGRISGSI